MLHYFIVTEYDRIWKDVYTKVYKKQKWSEFPQVQLVIKTSLSTNVAYSSVQSLSHVWLCNLKDCSMPGFPVHHQLLEFAQTQPSSWWYHPTISFFVVPFSFHLQCFPASVSFPLSQLFASGGQSIGASASASVLPMNIQDWFPLGLTRSPCSPRDSQESSPIPQFKSMNFLTLSFFYGPTLTFIHDYWKTIALTTGTFVGKVMSLLFNMLSRLVIAFLPWSKPLLISWLQSPSAVILEPPK